jgi:glycosyltransferase involved in cell wall biosynthesis
MNMITIGLIPANNAADTIADVVCVLRYSCDEVIVIDNASTDLTAFTARSAGAIVIKEDAVGKGNALRRGFRACLSNPRCEAIVTLDGDGENDPSDVLCLLDPILNSEAQVSFGVRSKTHSHVIFGHGTTGELLEDISGIRLHDPMSGVRAYSRKSISRLLPNLTRTGFGIDFQIAMEVIRLGIKWCEVFVSSYIGKPKDGWSLDHVSAALENLADYKAAGLFPSLSLLNVVSFSDSDPDQLVLKTKKWEYRFRRIGKLYIPYK